MNIVNSEDSRYTSLYHYYYYKILRIFFQKVYMEKHFWFMRQAGRYLPEYRATREQAGGFLKLCFNPELACEVTLQPIRRFDFSHSIIFSDILTIPYSLGYDVTIDENKGGPIVQTIGTIEEIEKLEKADLTKLSKVLTAIEKTREKLPQKTHLIGFCGAPWTLAIYMIQGKSNSTNQETHLFAYKNKIHFEKLITILTNTIIEYAEQQILAGCNTFQLFDSWASFLTDEEFENYVLKPHQTIFKTLKTKYPQITFIGFPRGIGTNYTKYVQQSECDIVGCDVSLSYETMENLQKYCGVQGNLDPLLLIQGGDLLESTVKKLCHLYQSGKYIFNLGHGILPQTPIEHVEKVIQIIKN